jgi:type IV pilus assembly protein PilZ
MTEQRGPVLRVQYKEKNALFQAFMSFTKDGGIYIPLSKDLPPMHSHVFVLVELPENKQLYPASGHICWINNGRKKGVGIRLDVDNDSKALRNAITTAIVSQLSSSAATLTM